MVNKRFVIEEPDIMKTSRSINKLEQELKEYTEQELRRNNEITLKKIKSPAYKRGPSYRECVEAINKLVDTYMQNARKKDPDQPELFED